MLNKINKFFETVRFCLLSMHIFDSSVLLSDTVFNEKSIKCANKKYDSFFA